MTIGQKLTNSALPIIDSVSDLENSDIQTDTVVSVKFHNTGGNYVGIVKYLVLTSGEYTSYTGSVIPLTGDVTIKNGNIAHALSNDITVTNTTDLSLIDGYKDMRVFVSSDKLDYIFNDANLSTEVTNDPSKDKYVAPNSDTSGASGAWVKNFVTSDKIEDGTITTTDLADSAVTTDKLATDAVTTNKLATDAVTADKIADDAVTYSKTNITPQELWTGSSTAVNISQLDGEGLYLIVANGEVYMCYALSGYYCAGTGYDFIDSVDTTAQAHRHAFFTGNTDSNFSVVKHDTEASPVQSLLTITSIRKIL